MTSKKDTKVVLGKSKEFLENIKGLSSSTYRDLLDTNINFYWEILGKEAARFELSSNKTLSNINLDTADPKFLFRNFGYLLHPNREDVLRRTSNPYRTFLSLLREAILSEEGRFESSSNPKDLEKILEKILSLDVSIDEGFLSTDISKQHFYRILVDIPEERPLDLDLQASIQDVSLLAGLVRPSHTILLVSPLFRDSFQFNRDLDTLFFFTGASTGLEAESYRSRKSGLRVNFGNSLMQSASFIEEDVSTQSDGENVDFVLSNFPLVKGLYGLDKTDTNVLPEDITVKVNGSTVPYDSYVVSGNIVSFLSAPSKYSLVKVSYSYNNNNYVDLEDISPSVDGSRKFFYLKRFPVTKGLDQVFDPDDLATASDLAGVFINGVPYSGVVLYPEEGIVEFPTPPASGSSVQVSYYYDSRKDLTGVEDLTPYTIERKTLVGDTFQVGNFPLVKGLGSYDVLSFDGSTPTIDKVKLNSYVSVYVNDFRVDIDSVDGETGTVVLSSAVASDDKVYAHYFYNKTYQKMYNINLVDPLYDSSAEMEPDHVVDVVPSVLIEPFFRREGARFVLDVSSITGDDYVGHDQMGGTVASFNQYALSYDVPSYFSHFNGGAYPTTLTPAWTLTGGIEGNPEAVLVSGGVSQTLASLGPDVYYSLDSASTAEESIFEVVFSLFGSVAGTSDSGVSLYIRWGDVTEYTATLQIRDDGVYSEDSSNYLYQGDAGSSYLFSSPTVLTVHGKNSSYDLYVNGVLHAEGVVATPTANPPSVYVEFGRRYSNDAATNVLWRTVRFTTATLTSVGYRENVGVLS